MATNKGSKYLSKGVKRTALSVALGMCFVGGVQAQTNTAGAIVGRAASGETITVTNPATGFSRTVTASSDGSYRFSAMPTGQYTVTTSGGATRTVTVNVGTASSADFVAAGDSASLDTITVTGNVINPIDVSSVESTTILTAEQIAKIPVARNTTAVALIAPGTVKGDAAFGNLASFGGSSVAENQYFLNGFNITNSFKNLNFVQVPFEAIAESQVKTGGYGAEFGRSTGGVINQISKRGTNEFHAGGNVFYSPKSLRETSPDQFSNEGELLTVYSEDTKDEWITSVWASGALVKDRLFGYALLQYGRKEDEVYGGPGQATSEVRESKDPMWLVKLDWNINDSNLLEFTGISDKREGETAYYDTVTASATDPSNPQRTTFRGTGFTETGGEAYVLKYTGYLTDSLTLSALAGTSTSARSTYSITADGVRNAYTGNVGGAVDGCPVITDARPSVVSGSTAAITGCSLASTLGRPDAEDTRDQYRIDLEWQLGDHLLRGGVDIDNFKSVDGESYSGGIAWRYGRYTATGYTGENEVVRKRVFQTGATVEVDQTAFYIEDSWSVTDNFVAYLGLRWDTFENKNGVGDTFVKIDNQFAPRLGFSWDVNGDSSFKVFGNAGRYALPLTSNVAVRGASASLYSEQFYTYTGVDPATGAPTGLTLIPNPNNGRDIRYLNNEFGLLKDPATIASTNLEPMYQDEYILGFQAQFTDHLSGGVRGIYRDLKRAIDDQCDYRPVLEWAVENGFTEDGGVFIEPGDKTQDSDIAVYNPGFPFCRLYNPGSDQTFNMDVNGDGTLESITLTADQLGPDAKRTYSAVEFFWEGHWDKLFLQGSYTFSRSKGNTEGGVKSDIGQDGTGVTQDFDYPELQDGAYGYLPNDRRHSFKLFGSYDLTEEWSVGGNLLIQSGRPINCFGLHPVDARYGNSYFYCDGERVNRGTAGRTPWSNSLDLNVVYRPSWAEGLQFKVDVFNVMNSDQVTSVYEFGEDTGGNLQPAVYKIPTGWQDPRSVRFMVQYDF